MTKTLEERIAIIETIAKKHISEEIHITDNSYDDAFWDGMERGEISASQGALNVIKQLQAENQDLLAKNAELEEQNRAWQGMVDSTNQTNQAMGNMLNEFEAKVKELEGKGWLPIESAPKDREYLGIITGTSYTGRYFAGNPFICCYDVEEGHICVHQTEIKPHRPTQWMPLPEAPKPTNLEE